MAGTRAIDDLQLRKQALVLESDLNRLALDAEWQHLRAASTWMGEAAQIHSQVRPWLLLLAPLGGILAARGVRHSKGMLGRLLAAVKWIRPLWAAWKTFSAPPATGEQKPAES